MYHIRTATLADIKSITEIYNYAVENTTGTFDTEIKTIENRMDWFTRRLPQFLILVCEMENKVIGYIALNPWSERKAYNITAEVSFYVIAEFQGKGIGKALLNAAIAMAKETTLNSLISRITQGNDNSIHLHNNEGFETIGRMKQAGEKFGKLLDVTLMQKMLR